MSVDDPQGRIYLLLDVDEHTGGFAGARAFFDETRRRGDSIEGVMIGYPGNDRVVIGGRGFTRYEVTVRGMSGHSGSRSRTAVNAVSKAAALVSQIDAATPSLPFDADFGMKPEATVTRVVGGESYSVVPDICAMYVDIRTTGAFGREAASEWLQQIITRVDDEWPSPPTQVTITGSQDAFRVPAQATFVEALATSASAVFDRPIPAEVVGPSNVGNYFASFGVPATAGFGVTYRGLHAVNECIEVATLQPSYETYLGAIAALMGTSSKAASA
jgi:succinyl-diaminopimelate desuccinylase